MEEEEREGSVGNPKFHVGRLGWRDFDGQTSGKRLAWKQLV